MSHKSSTKSHLHSASDLPLAKHATELQKMDAADSSKKYSPRQELTALHSASSKGMQSRDTSLLMQWQISLSHDWGHWESYPGMVEKVDDTLLVAALVEIVDEIEDDALVELLDEMGDEVLVAECVDEVLPNDNEASVLLDELELIATVLDVVPTGVVVDPVNG